jgi:hypothetical protein
MRREASLVRQSSSLAQTYRYKPRVVEELAAHGLKPLPTTTPQQLRDAVRDLYKFEIRRLRDEVLARRIARPDYAGHVVELRKRYPILSLPVELWLEPGEGDR